MTVNKEADRTLSHSHLEQCRNLLQVLFNALLIMPLIYTCYVFVLVSQFDKPDSRPSFVIMLSGYLATFHKREGRRSHEIHLDHDNFEQHIFLVDFKEWAETWCEV